MRKFLAMMLSLVMVLGLMVPAASAAEEPVAKSDDIVLLTTNDVHCHIDSDIGYATLAGLRDQLKEEYNNVFLLDAGDHAQGTAFGGMDKGKTMIELMNAAKYDVATLGNHEFDYDQEGRINITDKWAKFPYVSCNFYEEKDGVRGDYVVDPYVMLPLANGQTLAVVGMTTPETFTKSTPKYFQDENGEYIYGISGGEDGQELYDDVQKAIDDATEAGADYVVGLGHLGIDPASAPWTSVDVIEHTRGLTAMVDGHSHTKVEGKLVKDLDGKDVMLTQTKCYFNYIGQIIIDAETGAVTAKLLGPEDLAAVVPDPEVKALNDAWVEEIGAKLGEKIGHTDLLFDNFDENGLRLVRKQQTNTGAFAADALYYYFDEMGKEANFDVDIAVMNGGGVRNAGLTGDISYLTCKDIHTFGNEACLISVTGQQVLDALEWGARAVGMGEGEDGECGGFLQTSGLRYTVDTTIEPTVQFNEKRVWTGAPTGEYRVKNVEVYDKETDSWLPLDLEATYNMAGYNYTLRNSGDGFAMLQGAGMVQDRVDLDYMILANYVQGFEDCEVKGENSPLNMQYPGMLIDYTEVTGDGRIPIWTADEQPGYPQPEEQPEPPVDPDVDPEEKPEVDPEEKPEVPEVDPETKPEVESETKPEEKPESPETGDNGVMLYAALALVAVAGTAVVLKKKEQF